MNSGEINELILKIVLVFLRDNTDLSFKLINDIKSVGFCSSEYANLPNGFNLNDLKQMNEQQIIELCRKVGIQKSPAKAKSDVYINKIGYSLKSFSSAPPAIVNHTSRPGFETACRYATVDIKDLDRLINRYWELREQGIIKEDVKNIDYSSPFKDYKHVFAPILQYFLFKGTGSGISDFPAQYILDYNNPINYQTWRILDKDGIIEKVWDKLIFSLRSKKGMPANYPNNINKTLNSSISIWTKYFQHEYRGALHIRCAI